MRELTLSCLQQPPRRRYQSLGLPSSSWCRELCTGAAESLNHSGFGAPRPGQVMGLGLSPSIVPRSWLQSDPVQEKRLTPALRGRSAPRQVHPVVGGAVDGGVPDEGQTLRTAVRHLCAVGELLRSQARVLPVGDSRRGVTDCGIRGTDKKRNAQLSYSGENQNCIWEISTRVNFVFVARQIHMKLLPGFLPLTSAQGTHFSLSSHLGHISRERTPERFQPMSR